MHTLLETIKKHHFRGRVDSINVEELKRFAVEIAALDMERVVAAIEALVLKPAELIASIGADLDPITAVAPVRFTCDRCGKCCSSFRIGISWADITFYLQQGSTSIFPLVIVPEDRPYYQLMTKREFLAVKTTFSAENLRAVEAINPSLTKVPDGDLENCVFFNPVARTCTIHGMKPLECRTYPAGNFVFDDKENACDPACFHKGQDVDLLELTRLLDQKRVPDYVLSMLFGIAQPGGWRVDFFKIGLLFERCRSA